MKKLVNRRSLKFQLWAYFGAFALFIMVIIWLLQIFFLNTYYENMKAHEIEKLGRELIAEYGSDTFEDYAAQLSYKNGIIVQIFDENGTMLFPNETMPGGMPPMHSSPREFHTFLEEVEKSNHLDGVTYTVDSERFKTHMVIFGAKLQNAEGGTEYLYINSPLAPIGATTQVLQNQLVIVIILSLVISFILSYFIATQIAKPIISITKSANILGKGDYNVKFQSGSYSEINQLADVLNHTTQELSKTDSLRRDLIANVSHDLRTPLTIIKSYAEMIRDISGNNPEKRATHTQVIIDETDRLSALVTDILDLSKIEAGTTKLECSRFSLSLAVQDILYRFHLLVEKEGYVFDVHLEEDTFVYADENRIEQVLYNLISNAVNYTGADKTVTITTQHVDDHVTCTVSDTGKGISKEEIPKIWQRYYKSSERGHRTSHGTGIGLSIVQGILNQHHADYGVESEKGHGASFWFSLPYANHEPTQDADNGKQKSLPQSFLF